MSEQSNYRGTPLKIISGALIISICVILVQNCIPTPLPVGDTGVITAQDGNDVYITENANKWNETDQNLFTYGGILDGSYIITIDHTNNKIYVPTNQSGFTLSTAQNSYTISNIKLNPDSSITFNWTVTQ